MIIGFFIAKVYTPTKRNQLLKYAVFRLSKEFLLLLLKEIKLRYALGLKVKKLSALLPNGFSIIN